MKARDNTTSQFASLCLPVTRADQRFLLHPQRVMYWPAQQTLFAADVHMGKEHEFARQGIAIPAGISESTLQRLFTLANDSGAQRLIVLGDFMHAAPSASESWLDQLSELMDNYSQLSVEVVAGNHDREAGRILTDPRLLWHPSSLLVEDLALHHEPCEDARGYVLAGHLHPVYRLGSRRCGGVRAPVFWFRERCAVLPAFGEFTGGMIIEPESRTDSLFITGPDCVMRVPPKTTRRMRNS